MNNTLITFALDVLGAVALFGLLKVLNKPSHKCMTKLACITVLPTILCLVVCTVIAFSINNPALSVKESLEAMEIILNCFISMAVLVCLTALVGMSILKMGDVKPFDMETKFTIIMMTLLYSGNLLYHNSDCLMYALQMCALTSGIAYVYYALDKLGILDLVLHTEEGDKQNVNQ